MGPSLSEDDLILRLEQADEFDGEPVDSTLAGVRADLETLVKDVRQPAPPGRRSAKRLGSLRF